MFAKWLESLVQNWYMSKLSSETCQVTGSLWSSCWFGPQCFFTSTCTIWFSRASVSMIFLTNHHKLTSNLTSLSLSCSGGQKAEAELLAGGAEEKPIHFPGAHGFWPPLDFLDLQYLPGSPCLTSHDTSPVSGHLCPNSLFLKTSRLLTNVHLGCYASILTWLRLETP